MELAVGFTELSVAPAPTSMNGKNYQAASEKRKVKQSSGNSLRMRGRLRWDCKLKYLLRGQKKKNFFLYQKIRVSLSWRENGFLVFHKCRVTFCEINENGTFLYKVDGKSTMYGSCWYFGYFIIRLYLILSFYKMAEGKKKCQIKFCASLLVYVFRFRSRYFVNLIFNFRTAKLFQAFLIQEECFVYNFVGAFSLSIGLFFPFFFFEVTFPLKILFHFITLMPLSALMFFYLLHFSSLSPASQKGKRSPCCEKYLRIHRNSTPASSEIYTHTRAKRSEKPGAEMQ